MKLLIVPLLLLIIIAVSVQFVNFSYMDMTTTNSISSLDVNSTQLTDLGVTSSTFSITLMAGFLALFISISVIGILSGLNISVLGSTVQISERSQNILYHSLFYGGLWGIFSTLATIGISGIGLFNVPYGTIFYMLMTLFYVLGINSQIQQTSG